MCIRDRIGPAGCGKTYLSVHKALRELGDKESSIDGIVIVKPLVEAAGEKIGFLPGDVEEKTAPFMMSFYYNMEQIIGKQRLDVLRAAGIVKVVPLAYMRGRTLNDAFLILDEAQNTTPAQMRMVLTRLGERSRMVVTGDVTQQDLPPGQLSGLVEAAEVMDGVPGVAVCHLTAADVVRHPLVQRVVEAYASFDEQAHPQTGADSGLLPGPEVEQP